MEAADFGAFEDRGIVGIDDDVAFRMRGVRLADHAEERFLTRLAVDHPRSVEDLVPAVFGVGLGEHHQFDVGRIALRATHEDFDQVIDLVLGERQPQAHVGLDQRGAAAAEQVDAGELFRREMAEQFGGLGEAAEHGFDHSVVEQRGNGAAVGAGRQFDVEGDAALDAFNGGQAAVPGDVGGFRRPRRDGADAWGDEEQRARRIGRGGRHFLEQRGELLALSGVEFAFQFGHMPILGAGEAGAGHGGGDSLLQALETESGERGSPAQEEDVGHGR